MTAPIRPDPGRPQLPPLHRILTPEEFEQAKQMTPDALAQNPFPVLPPLAPRDQTNTRATPQNNPNPGHLPEPVRSIMQYGVDPLLNSPITTAMTVPLSMEGGVLGKAVRYGFGLLMGRDIATYAAQKAAEMTLPPDVKAMAENDPERISGKQALVEAGMLTLPVAAHAGAKAMAASGVDMGAPSPQLSEPAALELKRAVTQHSQDFADSFNQIFDPAARSPEAAQAAGILRATTGHQAAAYEQAAFKLDEFRRAIDPLPQADKYAFIDAIEGGKAQPNPEFQPAADAMRKILDGARQDVQDLGTGKLEHWIDNYFPHIWEDPEAAKAAFEGKDALEQAKISTGGKRPMEGSRSFLKQRSIPTTADGLALGLKPVSDNPVDLTLLKLREMQRYVMAHQSLNEMKAADLVKYVPAGGEVPDGYTRINDRVATVFGKPTVTVTEAFDAQQRAKIENVVNSLDVSLERKPSLGRQPGLSANALGYALGDKGIVAKFGTHDGVLMHELGHIVDNRFGLQRVLARVPNAQAELSALADLRAETTPNVSAKFRDYIQQNDERAANALHAFLHAPERMEQVAPNIKARLDTFLQSKPELQAIRDIKPSLELGTRKAEVPVGGMVIRGEHWAPEPVTNVVNNYLSPGLRGNAIYDAYRGLGNTLNQAQLGLSAFHLGMTSLDASVSRAALGLEYIASGKPLQGLGEIASAPVAPVTNALLGAKIRAAYLNPETASPEMQALANAVKEAGGRVRQDSFYQNSAPEKMAKAWREGDFGKAVGFSFPALFEYASKPLMEHIVPMQKLGVFGDMAQKILADLPPDATLADRRAALGKAWDSVDNRMGQLVYDNLFWNKAAKDLAMASVRSVGWNLGTIREIGGGLGDVASNAGKLVTGGDAELTHRAAYVAALPLTVGLYGAAYQLLRTGAGPSELKDYFHPKTGEVDADGNPERVNLPSYMKDMFAYAGHPWETVKHKEAPLLSAMGEMLNNEDFYGDKIRNENDPWPKQVLQEANYALDQLTPFSFRNASEQSKRGDQSFATKAGNWVGITPARREDVRSGAQNLMASYLSAGPSGRTPEAADVAHTKADILAAVRRGDTDGLSDAVHDAIAQHQLVPQDIVALLKRAGSTPAQEKFKTLTLEQAVNVFNASTPAEKAKFGGLLVKKLESASLKAQGSR